MIRGQEELAINENESIAKIVTCNVRLFCVDDINQIIRQGTVLFLTLTV